MAETQFILPAGSPELELSTTSEQEHTFIVPSGQRWLVLFAIAENDTQAATSTYAISVDGTNFSPYLSDQRVCYLPAGGKIKTKLSAFTAGDSVIHSVHIIKYRQI